MNCNTNFNSSSRPTPARSAIAGIAFAGWQGTFGEQTSIYCGIPSSYQSGVSKSPTQVVNFENSFSPGEKVHT